MSTIYVGVDVSKGYVDVVFLNDAGSVLGEPYLFDDTPKGHKAMMSVLTELVRRDKEISFMIGVESSGGLEKNWLKFFSSISVQLPVSPYYLNPFCVKKFMARELHGGKTDILSANAIALYLKRGLRLSDKPYVEENTSDRLRFNLIRSFSKHCALMTNQLHILLIQVQPYLVQYCRSGFPDWILNLLVKYPTAKKSATAKPEKIAKIPYITLLKAQDLIAQAKESVGALTDSNTARTIELLASELLRNQKLVEDEKKSLIKSNSNNMDKEILTSIPGFGEWTAIGFLTLIGDISKFQKASSLIAYIGSEPVVEISGDLKINRGISHHGSKELRALLYPATLAAISFNKVIRNFYDRLREKGKSHLVAMMACMNKLIRIAYSCLKTRMKFDASYGEKRRQEIETRAQLERKQNVRKRYKVSISLESPISARKAKERREMRKATENITRSHASKIYGVKHHKTQCLPHPSL